MPYVVKVLVTAVLVVAIAEVSKRSTTFGALMASIPLTSVLAMTWMYADTGEVEPIAQLSASIFWLVLPSLLLFVVLPVLLRQGWGFGWSMAASMAITAAGYAVLVPTLRAFGIEV